MKNKVNTFEANYMYLFYLFTHTTTSSLLAEAINVEVNMVDERIGTIAGSRRRVRVVE